MRQQQGGFTVEYGFVGLQLRTMIVTMAAYVDAFKRLADAQRTLRNVQRLNRISLITVALNVGFLIYNIFTRWAVFVALWRRLT